MTDTITMEKVYDELKKIESKMVTKKEMESLMETLEILGNPETMDQLHSSKKDIAAGKLRKTDSVSDMINDS
tara:strand:- start:494 stop:709 length:216 start_codon:yes stop_codon:yes gene_type:complete